MRLSEAPIETAGITGTIEPYHAPFRAAFIKIRLDMYCSVAYADCLKMCSHAVNAKVGPKGLFKSS